MLLRDRLQAISPLAFAALRIVAGFMFVLHGVQKVFGAFGHEAVPLASQAGVGGVIELVTGTLIALGLLTRPAAFLASGQMAVAYFQFHVAKTGKILPIQNGGDDTVLYCFLFLAIFFAGPGPYSASEWRRDVIDAKLSS